MTWIMKRWCSMVLILAIMIGLVATAAPTAHAAGSPVTVGVDQEPTAVRVDVASTGMFALRYGDLVSAGVDPAVIDPATLRLTYMDSEVAIEVTGQDDGVFDPTDEIRFYGKARDSVYGDVASYRLSWGQANGLRMAQRSAGPNGAAQPDAYLETIHLERDNVYASNLPMEASADHWFMDSWRLNAYTPMNILHYTFAGLAPAASGNAVLRVALQGRQQDWYMNPDYHVQFYVNGTVIGDATFDGTTPFVVELTFDNSLLVAGDNEITVEALDDLGSTVTTMGYTNWLELAYQRQYVGSDAGGRIAIDQPGAWQVSVTGFSSDDIAVYDVSDPTGVQRLVDVQVGGGTVTFGDTVATGTSYWVVSQGILPGPLAVVIDQPSDLRNPANGADYIVISHSDFMAQAQQLATYRAAQGLRAMAVDVQDIYDEFSGSMMTPQAIKDFLSFAYSNWTAPAPTYVVLLGDGSYDFKNNTGMGQTVFIPPYLDLLDQNVGETAADNRYVDFLGDRLPEMQIGRLPASTVAQAQTMVDKIIAYEAASTSAAWLDDVLLVADEPDILTADFPALSDEALPLIPDAYTVERVYYKTTSGHGTAQAVRDAIVAGIDQGRAFTNYLGHGSVTAWGGSLFSTGDVANLTNGDRPTIVTAFGCEIGYFVNPYMPSLAERLINEDGGGAVAVFAASGKGTAVGQQWLYLGFYDAIFHQGVERLGDAAVYAKQYLWANDTRWVDLLDTFHLFGDPALLIRRPTPDVAVDLEVTPSDPVPGSQVSLVINYANQGLLAATDTVINLTLPQELILAAAQDGQAYGWSAATSQQSWTIGELAPGASGVITVTATVDGGLQGGELLVSQAQGTTGSGDGDPANNIDTAEMVVSAAPKATVQGMAFVDVNGNGLQDPGENTGVSDVAVALKNAAGAMIASAITGSDGWFAFANLEAGTYTVEAESHASMVPTSPMSQQVTVAEGGTATANFGFIPTTGVSFLDFSYQVVADGVQLSWTVQDESGVTGYQVLRADSPGGEPQALSPLPIPVQASPGQTTYRFVDHGAVAGATYWYFVKALGANITHGPIQVTVPPSGAGTFHVFMPAMNAG